MTSHSDDDFSSFLAQYAHDSNGNNRTAKDFYDLSLSLFCRFKNHGDLQALTNSLLAVQVAVFLNSHGGDVDRASCLQQLGVVLVSRFQRLGDSTDITLAISACEGAVELSSDDHPDKAERLSLLGSAFLNRFRRGDDLRDVARAILAGQRAIEITPDSDLGKTMYLSNCALAFQARYQRLGDLDDLTQAISLGQRAVELAPDHHPNKVNYLNNSAASLQMRFDRLGNLEDIEKAVDVVQKAVDLHPEGHVNSLSNLGLFLKKRFSRLSNLEDLTQSISATQRALDLLPDDHPNKPLILNNQGIAYRERYERLGNADDIAQAVSLGQQAVDLTPDDHPVQPRHLTNVGIAYRERFRLFGDTADLTRALDACQRSVSLTPDDHHLKATRLHSLGNVFSVRFDSLGDLEDLSQAIIAIRHATNLASDDEPDKATYCSNLSSALWERFERHDDSEDMEEAVFMAHRAVELTPDNHPNISARLNHLGIALLTRFNHADNPEDLAQAARALTRAVDVIPDDHPDKPSILNSLSTTLLKRFKLAGDEEDMKLAISTGQKSVTLAPVGRRTNAIFFHNLRHAHLLRYECFGDVQDLICSLSFGADALRLTLEGHPYRIVVLYGLGLVFRSSFWSTRDQTHLAGAIKMFEAASIDLSGSPSRRFQATVQCAELCMLPYPSPSPQLAFERMFTLIPLLVTLDRPLEKRFKDAAREIGAAVNLAAAYAISSGQPVLALEWLEAGRSIVWGQLFQFRSPIDELRTMHPECANEFQHIVRALQAPVSDVRHTRDIPDLEKEVHTRLQLVRKFDALLEDVRKLVGFEDFMRVPKLPKLNESLSGLDGPVVVINMHHSRCDALVVSPHSTVRLIPLPHLSLKLALSIHSKMTREFSRGRTAYSGDEDARGNSVRGTVPASKSEGLRRVLSCLWRTIVQPILVAIEDILCDFTFDRKPHVTWCPTGRLALLPLHAAGVYDGVHALNASDFIVSSYAPSLTALLRALKAGGIPTTTPRVICVSQVYSPSHPTLPPLPGVLKEAEVLQECFEDSVTCLQDGHGTVSEVLRSINDHSWIHLACHGVQDRDNPTNSGFLLHDRRLTLSDLMRQSKHGAEFAFLSACETATGDENIPDEAVHLVAGMLAVGYRGVVGTTWAIHDSDAPVVAAAFYTAMISGRRNREVGAAYTGAAYALDEAIVQLRRTVGEDSFTRWAPYVHFGL
ncbi:CHAT domain-containing protein [Vararia minispora EC-137]|uniref:CHAT domain-containing protein n=1 Tax=Vararia minispora EC-137 TaxID=1314806 RepID=A0ACB8Q744_9AGAM|nr:CHAT domain-containing protein [Vararia minispora EC-137]